MNIIQVVDVFGRAPALLKLSKELYTEIIGDPYNGMNVGFKNRAEALKQ